MKEVEIFKVQDSRVSIFSALRSLWRKLKKRRKVQIIASIFLILISGISEMVSLGLIVPFLTVLIDPKLLYDNSFVSTTFSLINLDKVGDQRLLFTFLFAISSILSNAIRLFNIWVITYLSQKIGNDLSTEALYRTLRQPYSVHINRNSNIIIAGLTHHVLQTIVAINFSLQLIAALIILICLMFTLIAFDPSIAILSILMFTLAYIFFGFRFKKRLSNNSQKITKITKNILKVLQESLGSIRDIIINNKTQYFYRLHNKYDRNLRLLNAENIFITSIPRYSMEAFGICFICFISYLMTININSEKDINIIPMLGILAFSSQRILPALYQVFKSWSALQIAKDSVIQLMKLLEQPIKKKKLISDKKLLFTKQIEFRGVSFKYNNESKLILKDINFTIKKGSRIGIIGETGSGKSTTVDLLMGLLSPTYGSILVDNKELHKGEDEDIFYQWRNNIAHVPQEIYISDSSFAENIAFGFDLEYINMERVKKSAKLAKISDYIESTPNKYKTLLGERGTKLSGGQLQRIGIARSLYLDREILVLDEATSSLDTITEENIMQSLKTLSNDITIIMISHRLSTLNQCDKIFSINNGIINETDL